MSTIVFISVTSHVALAGNYNYLPLVSIKYFFYSQQTPQQAMAFYLEKNSYPHPEGTPSVILFHPAWMRLLEFSIDFIHRAW